MDADGYPDDAELDRIRTWPYTDFPGLMEYVKARWRYAEDGYWRQEGASTYLISTGGWSGNESIIGALKDNQVFWLLCWVRSERGGHYRFTLPKIKSSNPPIEKEEKHGPARTK